MPGDIAVGAVHQMACFMQRYYKENVIILLDEYDTPMQEAWLSGYWNKAVSFFSNFFNATFKTNPYLERGMITGITRIAKESIFTGMNNLKVVTTTSDRYATAFGFTEKEVFDALDDVGFGSEKKDVKKWYDGYQFGSVDIYNPWSIASFIENNGKYENYWADTSSNGLVNALMQTGVPGIKQTMEALLQGKSFEAELDEKIVFDQLDGSVSAVWSLLLATGYLNTFSSFDSGNKPSEQTEPERFYHGFVLGMVVNMADTYIVRSNRESGYGRYDVMLEPVDKNGKAFIFEFKVLDPDEDEVTLEDTLAAAHRQIAEKKYETELVSRGFAAEKIRRYGFAFRGRECLIG